MPWELEVGVCLRREFHSCFDGTKVITHPSGAQRYTVIFVLVHFPTAGFGVLPLPELCTPSLSVRFLGISVGLFLLLCRVCIVSPRDYAECFTVR